MQYFKLNSLVKKITYIFLNLYISERAACSFEVLSEIFLNSCWSLACTSGSITYSYFNKRVHNLYDY